jgi:hypothetical protein
MICLHMKLYMHSSNRSYVTIKEPEYNLDFMQSPCCSFYSRRNYLIKIMISVSCIT